MRQTNEIVDDRKLRTMEIRSEKDVDVSEKVMERIAGRQGLRSRRTLSGFVGRHAAAIAFIVCAVLFASITGYAATQYLLLKNGRGEVVLRTKELKHDPYGAKLSAKIEKEWRRLEKLVKPGELVAFYVMDADPDAHRWNQIHFRYVPLRHANYDDFLAQLRATNGPELPRPGYLPEGYAFEAASVQARFEPMPPSPEYEALVDELLAEAEAAADGRTLFYRVLPWSVADGANVQYRKGEAVLNLFAYKSNGKAELPLAPEAKAEKTEAGGTEMILYESEEGSEARKHYRHRAIWYGTEEQALYVIADDPEHPLEKQELIRIAESMIAQGKRP